MMALKAGSVTSTVIGQFIYTSVQFKILSESLEELNNIEDSDIKIERNTSNSLAYT
jgi:hypothetical protein